jgi:hypothetical protein
MKTHRTAIVPAIVGSMHKAALLAAIATLVPCVAVAHVVRHNSIPQPYLGRWAADAATCKDPDTPAVVLAAKTYVAPGTSCIVGWVSETAGPHGPIFAAHLQCATEKTKNKTVSNVIIRPDSDNQISIGSDFASMKSYQRCPTATPAAAR